MRSAVAALALAGSASAAAVSAAPAAPSVAQLINKANPTRYTATSTAAVDAAAATAKVSSPTSDIRGLAFDRFYTIWLENTDYEFAASDPNLQWLAQKGITLTNYYGVAHPSEPNYCASHAGDNFGMDNDAFHMIPNNVYTVIDLLEDRGISWATYQEGMPYAGFEGYSWINGTTGQNNYVRKHHPAPLFNINSQSAQRLSQMKNYTSFYEDLEHRRLPQWAFITPNMLNDGHDTGVTYAAANLRPMLEPLLENPYFMENTLILVTFDETETYSEKNNVFSFLIGGAVPQNLVNTTDDSFYNHYSELSTVEANWNLHTLGRWDVGANVFKFVGEQTGDKIRQWKKTNFTNVYLNDSFAGPLSSINSSVGWPVPNIHAKHSERTVLPAIVNTWKGAVNKTWYTTDVEIAWGQEPPAGYLPAFDA